jgi:hypothetical protein
MKINLTVEPMVREALAAAVGQERQRYDQAVLLLAENGEKSLVESINLGLSVAGFALADLHQGRRPAPAQIDRLAADFVESEAWSNIEQVSVREILRALTEGDPVDLAPGDTAFSLFAIDAWLLSAFGPEDRPWNQYLDQILVALESSTGR